jgi:flagellum-specific ATP synthase
LAAYAEHEDLLSIGAYRRGSNREVDAAVEFRDAIEALFRQPVDRALSLDQVVSQLEDLAAQCQTKMDGPAAVGSPPVAAVPAASQTPPSIG